MSVEHADFFNHIDLRDAFFERPTPGNLQMTICWCCEIKVLTLAEANVYEPCLRSMKRHAVHIKSVALTYHTGRMSLAEGYEKIGPLHDR